MAWKIGDKIFVLNKADGTKSNARIVAVNMAKMQVKLRYIGWNPKPDEWFSMKSDCLIHSTVNKKQPPSQKKMKLRVGQQVLGEWSDGVWYPGVVQELRSTGSVVIHFYDGLKKALRLNHVRPTSPDEYKKRLTEVLKTAEEMDRSLIQASSVTLGRTRRQDQIVQNPGTSTASSSQPAPQSLPNTSTTSVSHENSDIDDTPLSALASTTKRPRRSSSRALSKSQPRKASVATNEGTKPRRASTTGKVQSSLKNQQQSVSKKRSNPKSEASAGVSAKFRRQSAPVSMKTNSAGAKDGSGDLNLTIIHCTCGKSKQDGATVQCSLCLTWQHASCSQRQQPSTSRSGKAEAALSYVCQFCLYPTNARPQLRQRIRSHVLSRGIEPRFNSRNSRQRVPSPSIGCQLSQLCVHAETVLGLLRQGRQFLDQILTSPDDDQNQDYVDSIQAIHNHAESVLSRIESAIEIEADRMAAEPSLTKYQSERLASLSLRDILGDVQTLQGMFHRAETANTSPSAPKTAKATSSTGAANKPTTAAATTSASTSTPKTPVLMSATTSTITKG